MGLLEVINGHVAIVVAYRHQVGMVHMHVETHDAAVTAEDVFREAGVLHAVEQQHAPALLHEVICPKEDGPLWLENPATLLGSPLCPFPTRRTSPALLCLCWSVWASSLASSSPSVK